MTDASPEDIRVLIVDDEKPARDRLIDALRKDGHVTAILEASNGLAAVEMIEREHPDLVLLDVQMPELDGLGVLDAIDPQSMPLTVFVTAYDQHAMRAFESNALDYLLKPYSDERLEATLARARKRLRQQKAGEFAQHVLHMLATVPRKAQYLDRLIIKSTGATHFLKVTEIDWIEGARVYVNLHVAGKALLYRTALSQLEARLDPAQFVRIHRSAIINIDSIVRLEAASHGEFDVILKHGGQARLSRTYRGVLEQRLGQLL